MYTELFKLRNCLQAEPRPAFLYLSKNHSRAKAYMESTIWFTDGFVVITGEIGAGKTTLIETFLSEIDKDVVVAQIQPDPSVVNRIPAGAAGAVRLRALQDEEGRADLDAQQVPDRAVRGRHKCC